MDSVLRQSTAGQIRAIGPFLDATDYKTPETGLTIANTDIKLVANGGASADKNSGGATARVNGIYGITLDATDTATIGELSVSIVVAGALPVWHKFVVVEEAVYDRDYAAAALGYVAAQVVASVTGAVGSVTGAVGSVTGNVGGNVTGSVGSVVGAVGSVTGAVGSVTGNVGGNVVGTVASVVGNVDGNVVGSVGSVTGAVGSVTGNVGGNVVGSVDSVVDPVTVGTINANVIDAASIAAGAFTAAKFAAGAFDAVWTVAARTLTSFGTLAADVWAVAVRTVSAATNITSTGGTTVPQTGDNYARLGAPAGVSVSADIAAVKAQTAAIEVDTGTDIPATLATLATAANLATVDTVVDAILVDTDTTIPALIVSETNAVQADIAAVDVNVLTRATPADVNAQVLDVLNVDTFAEPTGVPPATSTLQQKISRVYMALRNGVTVTASDKTFLDDGGAGEWKKPLADDGTTYTEGEGTTP